MRLSLLCVGSVLVTLVGCNDDVGSVTTFDPSTSSTGDTMSTTASTTMSTSTTSDDSTSSTSVDPTTDTTADTSAANTTNSGALCGDGVISGAEECDCGGISCTAEELGNNTCMDIDDPSIPGTITGGTLGCNPASCRFDTSQCTYCGDRIVNGNETCEPDVDITETCMDLGAGAAGPVTCDSACQVDTSKCTDCAVSFDFELATCPAGFSATSLNGAAAPSTWACGDPTVYAQGPGVASPGTFGTNLSGPYNANEISALVSPEIDFSNCMDDGIVMSLRHWHNFEGGASNADGGIVQASEDGVNWVTIEPVDGDLYDDVVVTATYDPVNGALGFSGSQDDNQWSLSNFDLTEYAGSATLQLRFVFGSNATTQQGGWYIDYINLLGSGSN